tara:strand:+ start:2771 stop:5164 length:2394 start_codon:yes stop_codon:yes gene_type:complete
MQAKKLNYVMKAKKLNYLGEKGYTIYKSNLSIEEQLDIRNELSVKPYVPKTIMIKVDEFAVYKESQNKFYVPKYFGIENFGIPNEIKIPDGDDINIKFKGDLRDYQKPIVQKFKDSIDINTGCGGGLIDLPCGQGKCHGINTPILMYNGEIKMVQDIKLNELLMGDDSNPRKVLKLATGEEMMYEIIQDYGDSYVVNESHILSLICTNDYKNYKKNNIYDISILEYLKLCEDFYNVLENSNYDFFLSGYKVAIEFPNKECKIDPYIFGCWLISSTNKLEHDIKIPNSYKINSINNRLKLLAGIIDSNAIKTINGYEIVLKNKLLIDDIIYLARTSGLNAELDIINEGSNIYFKVVIYGSNIDKLPLMINSKKYIDNYFSKDSLIYKIKIKKLWIDNYYGFNLDGNHRYLLGDTTVTHNTVLALNIISVVKKKTLIIVHKSFLLNQWIERIIEFLPDARIGQIQGQIIDIEDKDIVIGMLQSLSMKEYPAKIFNSFGFTIVDECHHISSEVFSRSLQTIITKVTLGLSATMQRKDGLTKVFKMFLGEIIYKGERNEDDNVLVKGIEYNVNDEEFNEVKYDFRGNPAYSTMISKLCLYNHRSEFILDVIINELKINPNQQIMILGQYKNILVYLYKAINHRNIASVGYYVGGMKEKDLKETEDKTIVIATYAMAAEGLDIKTLTTLIMVTPKTDITQSVGRILRVKHNQPLIIDIIDTHDLFKRQWLKRKNFYEKKNYNIIYTNNDLYKLDKWNTISKKNKTKNIKLNKNKNDTDNDSDNNDNVNDVKTIGKCLINLSL